MLLEFFFGLDCLFWLIWITTLPFFSGQSLFFSSFIFLFFLLLFFLLLFLFYSFFVFDFSYFLFVSSLILCWSVSVQFFLFSLLSSLHLFHFNFYFFVVFFSLLNMIFLEQGRNGESNTKLNFFYSFWASFVLFWFQLWSRQLCGRGSGFGILYWFGVSHFDLNFLVWILSSILFWKILRTLSYLISW